MENHQMSDNMKNRLEPLLTAEEVALRLHLSRSCVFHLMQIGLIPTVHLGSKSKRVSPQALEEFIILNTFSSDSDSR